MTTDATATSQTRRLKITACELITTGTGDGGREWRLYKITALDRRGDPITAELRSFEQLDAGVVDDFRIDRREDGRYGVSYTLKRNRGRINDRVTALEQSAGDHERRIAALEAAPP